MPMQIPTGSLKWRDDSSPNILAFSVEGFIRRCVWRNVLIFIRISDGDFFAGVGNVVL